MKDNGPPPKEYVKNCKECDRNLTKNMYLLKDIIGMVSFQKSLVENIYVTPFWFNGDFVVKNNKPVHPKTSKCLIKLKLAIFAIIKS